MNQLIVLQSEGDEWGGGSCTCIQGRHANTYINICTIKSILVNNTGKMQTHTHTQTNTKHINISACSHASNTNPI